MRKRVARKVLFGSEGYAVVHRSATIDKAHKTLRTKFVRYYERQGNRRFIIAGLKAIAEARKLGIPTR